MLPNSLDRSGFSGLCIRKTRMIDSLSPARSTVRRQALLINHTQGKNGRTSSSHP
jgi:hypothetical protein